MSFGTALRAARTAAGLSLRGLSTLVRYDHGYLGQVERGQRQPSPDLVAACDRALDAGGTLLDAYDQERAEGDMRRRTVLKALGALTPMSGQAETSLEALRQRLVSAGGVDYDEWQQVAEDYGRAYYTATAGELWRQAVADLSVVTAMAAADASPRRVELERAAARLAVVVGAVLTAGGQAMVAQRWWRAAAKAADRSGDVGTRVLVAAWDVVNGCYDGRPAPVVVALSDGPVSWGGGMVSAAAAGLWAGRAQAAALAGRGEEAVVAVRRVAEVTGRLPSRVLGDVESLWGWPEHRLLHTESFVYTCLGDTGRAREAQERVLGLYPESQGRLRAQVELHGAACEIREGHVSNGLRLAADVLDRLPVEHHNGLLRQVARHVLAVVPVSDRRLPGVVELEGRLAVSG